MIDLKRKGNEYLYFAIMVIAFSYVFINQANKIPGEAALMPKATLYIMLFLGIGMIIDSFKKFTEGSRVSLNVTLKDIFNGILGPGLILLLASLSLKKLGFYLVSFCLIVALLFFQSYVTRKRLNITPSNIARIMIFAFTTTLVMYVFFDVLLNLPTPKGILGF